MRARRVEPSVVARLCAWSGAAAFGLSLGYFLFTYLVTFGVPAPAGPSGPALAWNVVLFNAFALHHSVFARTRVRDRISRLVPGLERSLYVWIASMLFFLVCAWWRPVPGLAWQADGLLAWGLRAVQAAAGWLILRSAAILDIRELAGLVVRQPEGGERTEGDRKPEGFRLPGGGEFKTRGPYGWVRHPIYAGWFLLVFAASPMTMTRLVFAVVSCAYLVAAIPLEERSLRATSAGAYDRYARQVRWRLVPGVFGWWLLVVVGA